MVCFTFDDYEKYAYPYGVDIYLSQYKLLTSYWKRGLEILESERGNGQYEQLKRMAKTCYLHFKSAELLTRFSKLKNDIQANKQALLKTIDEEYETTKATYALAMTDATVGFEMTNHYYYNENRLLEKLLNLTALRERLEK